jgi:hypothetical protein
MFGQAGVSNASSNDVRETKVDVPLISSAPFADVVSNLPVKTPAVGVSLEVRKTAARTGQGVELGDLDGFYAAMSDSEKPFSLPKWSLGTLS